MDGGLRRTWAHTGPLAYVAGLFGLIFASWFDTTVKAEIAHAGPNPSACLDPLEDWSAFERNVWNEICGQARDGTFVTGNQSALAPGYRFDLKHLSADNSKLASACTDEQRAENWITGSFLRSMLSNSKIAEFLKLRGGIHLEGFTIRGALTLKGVETDIPIQLRRILFCDHVDISNAIFRRDVRIESSLVLTPRDDGRHALGRIYASGSRLESLRVTNTTAGVFDGSWITVRKELGLDDSTYGHVLLRNAELESELSVEGARQLSEFWHVYDGPEKNKAYGNRVDLNFARIKGLVDFDIIRIQGIFKFVRAELGGFTGKCADIASFDGSGSTIAGDVLFRFATLGYEGNKFKDTCVFTSKPKNEMIGLLGLGMKIGGRLDFHPGKECVRNPDESASDRPVRVNGSLCFSGMIVGGDVDLTGGVFDKVNLAGARVGGSVMLAGEDGQARWRATTAVNGPAELDLTGAEIGALQSCFRGPGSKVADWPASRRVTGAQVKRLTILACTPKQPPDTRMDIAAAGVSRLTDFLDNGGAEEGIVPYRVLERTVRNMGLNERADALAFAAEARITRDASLWEKPGRWLRLIFGGYGLNPLYPASVALFFVLTGTMVIRWSVDAKVYFDKRSYMECRGKTLRFFDFLICSLDRLIPVFTLSKAHQELLFETEPVVRYYFFLHGLIGWLLTSMVVLFLGDILGLKI